MTFLAGAAIAGVTFLGLLVIRWRLPSLGAVAAD
jgi:hypothetical protein